MDAHESRQQRRARERAEAKLTAGDQRAKLKAEAIRRQRWLTGTVFHPEVVHDLRYGTGWG